jgi:Methyltransferase domain
LWDKYRIHPASCVSAVMSAGKYDTVRKFFLDWFQSYLSEQDMGDSSVWTSLQKALSAYEPGAAIKGEMKLERNSWSLRVAGGNTATLTSPPDDSDALRIEIGTITTGTPYDIQLNQPRLRVFADERYLLKFRARADRSRPVGVGFAKAGAPWTNLGLYKTIDLASEWRDFCEEFAAVADEENARIHFDLGESGAPAELASITLSKIVGHELGVGKSDNAPRAEELNRSSRADEMIGQLGTAAITKRAAASPLSKDHDEASFTTPVSSDWGWDRGLPIDRYYIERFLSSHVGDIRGSVLEISDDWYTKKFGGDRVTKVDILDINKENPRATIIADLTRADHIPANTFDCIISPQTLQYIYDARAAVGSLHRILKKGGVLLATLPATTRTRSDDPSGSWYWVFTTNSAQRLFAEAFHGQDIQTSSYGNLHAAVSFLKGLASEELKPEELDYRDPNYQILVCVRAVKS